MSEPKPDRSRTDMASIGRVAANAKERRLALDDCLLEWKKEDIAVLKRVDDEEAEWHGWKMWRNGS